MLELFSESLETEIEETILLLDHVITNYTRRIFGANLAEMKSTNHFFWKCIRIWNSDAMRIITYSLKEMENRRSHWLVVEKMSMTCSTILCLNQVQLFEIQDTPPQSESYLMMLWGKKIMSKILKIQTIFKSKIRCKLPHSIYYLQIQDNHHLLWSALQWDDLNGAHSTTYY